MEHPCYRCQTEIAEGITFCPHCGAPQIRVVVPENDAPVPASPETSFGDVSVPPTTPQPAWQQYGATYPPPPSSAIRWELAWKGCLLCGIGSAVLSAIPIVSIGCCLWILGAGALAVSLYQKQLPGTVITPGMGMRVGALTGVFSFVVNAVVTTLSFVAFRSSADFRRAMQEQMDKQMATNPDPKVKEIMQHMVEWMSSPQGAATLIVAALVMMAVVFIVFTAAGGALGASIFGKRRELR